MSTAFGVANLAPFEVATLAQVPQRLFSLPTVVDRSQRPHPVEILRSSVRIVAPATHGRPRWPPRLLPCQCRGGGPHRTSSINPYGLFASLASVGITSAAPGGSAEANAADGCAAQNSPYLRAPVEPIHPGRSSNIELSGLRRQPIARAAEASIVVTSRQPRTRRAFVAMQKSLLSDRALAASMRDDDSPKGSEEARRLAQGDAVSVSSLGLTR